MSPNARDRACLYFLSLRTRPTSWIGSASASPRSTLKWRPQRGGCGSAIDPSRGRASGCHDFLIGTHAWMRADQFLTRDRGFYRTYFKRLRIVDPSTD
jgi:hypothetical protein